MAYKEGDYIFSGRFYVHSTYDASKAYTRYLLLETRTGPEIDGADVPIPPWVAAIQFNSERPIVRGGFYAYNEILRYIQKSRFDYNRIPLPNGAVPPADFGMTLIQAEDGIQIGNAGEVRIVAGRTGVDNHVYVNYGEGSFSLMDHDNDIEQLKQEVTELRELVETLTGVDSLALMEIAREIKRRS